MILPCAASPVNVFLPNINPKAAAFLAKRHISAETAEYLQWRFERRYVAIPFVDPNDPTYHDARYRKRFYESIEKPDGDTIKEIWDSDSKETIPRIYHRAGFDYAEADGDLVIASGPVDVAVYISATGKRNVIALPESAWFDLEGFLRLGTIRRVIHPPDRDTTGNDFCFEVQRQTKAAGREFVGLRLPDLKPEKTDLGDFLKTVDGGTQGAIDALYRLPEYTPTPPEKKTKAAPPSIPVDELPDGEFMRLLHDGKQGLPTYKPYTAEQREAVRRQAANHPLMQHYPDKWDFLNAIYFVAGLRHNKYVRLSQDAGIVALLLLVVYELWQRGELWPTAPVDAVTVARLSEGNRYYAIDERTARRALTLAAEIGIVEGITDKTEQLEAIPDSKCSLLSENTTGRGRPSKLYRFLPLDRALKVVVDRLSRFAALEVAYGRDDPAAPYVTMPADDLPVDDPAAADAVRADALAADDDARAAAESRLDHARRKLYGWANAKPKNNAVPMPAERISSVPDLRLHLLQHRISVEGDEFDPSKARSAIGYGRAAYHTALATLELRTIPRTLEGKIDPRDDAALAELDRQHYGWARLETEGGTGISVAPGESIKAAACRLVDKTIPGGVIEYRVQLTPEVVPADAPVSDDEAVIRERLSRAGQASAKTRAERGTQPGPRRKDRHANRFGRHFLYWQVGRYGIATTQQDADPLPWGEVQPTTAQPEQPPPRAIPAPVPKPRPFPLFRDMTAAAAVAR